jgi:hypothetical protein
VLKPSCYTAPELRRQIDAAGNPWDRWCDAYSQVGQDKEKKAYRFLLIPRELLEAALRLRGDGKRFLVCADEKLTAFLALEAPIRACVELP